MKEITECIGDIGRANSTIFSTLDLTSGFWQMQLEDKSQHGSQAFRKNGPSPHKNNEQTAICIIGT